MKNKYLNFVSDEHFINCIKWVCDAYPEKSKILDMKKLNKNSLDPFKMIFDILNSKLSVDEWINNEFVRQSDKTINNRIGEFHQKLLGGVSGWEDLGRGNPLGIDLKNDNNTIFIELKNKHNTVKGENHKDVFDKLKKVLDKNKKAIVYYAYIIPKKAGSGEKVWSPSQRTPNKRILECWGSRVYEIVTKDPNSLEDTWKAIPKAINDLLGSKNQLNSAEIKRLVEFFKTSII